MFLLLLAAFLECVHPQEQWHFTGLNVARHKVTTQIPIGIPLYAYGHPERAVDGGRSGNIGKRSCSYAFAGINSTASWSVDLNDSYIIKGIQIYNRNRLQERLDNFTVIGYPDETTLHDDSIVENKLARKDIINITVYSTTAFSNITIKIPGHEGPPDDGHSILTLCEVEVYTGINLAKSARSTTNGPISDNSSSLAVDGDKTGSCAVSHGENENSFWSVDLGEKYPITSIIIHNRQISRDLFKGFRVIGFPGNETLHEDSQELKTFYQEQPDIQLQVIPAISFSKIKIEVSASENDLFLNDYSALELCEVEIIGDLSYCHLPDTYDSSEWILRQGTWYVMASHGLVTVYSVFDVGCKPNYNLTGESRIRCLPNGTFNNVIPICVAVKPSSEPSAVFPVAAVGGGVGGCIVLEAVVAVAILVYLTRSEETTLKNTPSTDAIHTDQSTDDTYAKQSSDDIAETDTYAELNELATYLNSADHPYIHTTMADLWYLRFKCRK